MTVTCPYCDYENEEPELENQEDGDSDYTECSACDKHFEYTFQTSYSFDSDTMEETEGYLERLVRYKKERLQKAKGTSGSGKTSDYDYKLESLQTSEQELKEVKEMLKENSLINSR